MNYIIYLVTNSIFNGTLILVPCVFVVFLFKTGIPAIDRSTLIKAVNWTLLIGSTLFFLLITTEIADGFFSSEDYVSYSVMNRFFGPYWWAFWIGIFPGYISPQLFWFKRLRTTIITSVIVVFIWCAASLFVKLASNAQSWHIEFKYQFIDYLKQAVIYLAILSGVYIILSRKMAFSKPVI